MWATPGFPWGRVISDYRGSFSVIVLILFYFDVCHTAVDHSVVDFQFYSAVDHSEVDHSVVDF